MLFNCHSVTSVNLVKKKVTFTFGFTKNMKAVSWLITWEIT